VLVSRFPCLLEAVLLLAQQPAQSKRIYIYQTCHWQLMLAGALEEDALLEAVVLLGALAGQPEFDEPLAGCGLVSHCTCSM
jgi:hypothetical protein